MRTAVAIIGGLALLGVLSLVAFFALTPAPIASHAFDAGPAPALEGVLAPNDALARCEILAADEIDGPEELELDASGRVYSGTNDGTIVRLTVNGDGTHDVEVVADVGGRPNGLSFDAAGNLLVSEGRDHPARWADPDGNVRPFAVDHGQASAIASDGTIYLPRYTDPQETESLMVDVLMRMAEAAPTGELLSYRPETGETRVLMRGLIWPDGVALSSDEDFVAVGEVSAYRISRYWLRGPKAGTQDVLAENLPGMVDGLASDGAGRFYASIPRTRSALLDWFHRHPGWKDQTAKLLSPWFANLLIAASPGAKTGYGLVLVIDEDGAIVRSLHDPQTRIGPGINTAEPWRDTLYIGALGGRGIGRCPLGP